MAALLARRRVELEWTLKTLDWQMRRLRQRNEQTSDSILGDADVVVTLTSHGMRVNDAYYTLESIGRGTVRPRSVILYLQDQNTIDELSEPMLKLVERGLEVRLSDNFGPHTKYFPYVSAIPRHERPLVTADDDTIYPKSWLHDLTSGWRRLPAGAKEVLCIRSKTILLDDEGFEPYERWPFTIGDEASILHFATGVGGVVYPPELLDRLRDAGDDFVDKCLKADDVWLHATAIRNGFMIRQLGTMSEHPPAIPSGKGIALWRDNVTQGGNDRAIALTYTDADLAALRAASAAD